MADDIWTLTRSARVRGARDAAHFELLRAGDMLMRPVVRRVAAGTCVAAILVAGLAVHGAGADEPARTPRAGVHLTGSAAAQTYVGSGRNDRIDGRGGNDVLLGGKGDDVLIGGAGADVLQGESGDDKLTAGPGRDVLIGGAGDDELHASERDGLPDRLHCGPGNDTAWIVTVNGRTNDRTFDCERVIVLTVRTVTR